MALRRVLGIEGLRNDSERKAHCLAGTSHQSNTFAKHRYEFGVAGPRSDCGFNTLPLGTRP